MSLLACTHRASALVQRSGRATRSATLRTCRPKPFSAARPLVHVRAAAEEAPVEEAPIVTPEEMADLLEDEQDGILDYYANLAAGLEDNTVDDEVDRDLTEEDWAAAMEAAELVGSDGIDSYTAAAIGAEEEEDEESRAFAEANAALLFEQRMEAGDLSVEELADLTNEIDEAELTAVELEDMVPASNSDRYEEVPSSTADKEAMGQYKLSKPELKNLLPEDWDQINIDFFANKKDENIPLPEHRLNVLWTEKNLAVAVDQVYSRGQVSPLTEYYFWPRQDAWEELRRNLEDRPWISDRDRILLLNRLTQLINYWQDEEVKHSVDEARAEFPDCAFTLA